MPGVFVAITLKHLVAVYVGNYLTNIIPLHFIKISAAVSFLIVGLWTIKCDRLEEKTNRFNFSSFWSVTIAFFLAEMADNTQLATVKLVAEFNSVVPV